MTSQSAAWPNDDDEVNPKIDPALNSNAEKEPDDWVSGGDPMAGAQASYSKLGPKSGTHQRVSKRISPRLRPRNGSMH
jgi:hypothetical protein